MTLFMLSVIQSNVLGGLGALEDKLLSSWSLSALAQAFITALGVGVLRTKGDLLLSAGTFYFTASRREDDY